VCDEVCFLHQVLCEQRRLQQPREGEGATLNNFLMEFKEVLTSVGMQVDPVRHLALPRPPSLSLANSDPLR
jgi:hypothetical protein